MRVFLNNIEFSSDVDRYDSSAYEMDYLFGDYIYISSDFPFNHLFFKIGTVKNNITATMKVEYFSNNWIQAVELRDGTNAFFNDGFIEFTPNRNMSWSRAFDSSLVGVSTVVYDKYWIRISFEKDLKPNVSLSFIGNVFSDDSDLFSEYPIFDDANFLTAFKASKTDWQEQHIKAANIICSDLQKKGVIIAKEQILDRKKFTGASVCKVAEIIFNSFGNDYDSGRKLAKDEYNSRLDLSQYNTDLNGDAILQPSEQVATQGWLNR